jgi:tetratricopeptide (TPR) repeat protein
MEIRTVILWGFLLLLPSVSCASVNELETAIIQADYQKAKQLSSQLLSGANLAGDQADQVKFYLALSQLRLGEYEASIKLFNELIRQPLEAQLRDRSYLGLFNAHYLSEEYGQAKNVIEKLLQISPDSPFMSMIYLKLARVNLKLTNWSKAKEYLGKIINEFPQSSEAHMAKQLLQEKQYFAVQVGAFLDRGHAEQIVDQLRHKGDYGYIIETTDAQERTFYRVRVGQMTLLDDARQLKERLAKQGYPTEIYP